MTGNAGQHATKRARSMVARDDEATSLVLKRQNGQGAEWASRHGACRAEAREKHLSAGAEELQAKPRPPPALAAKTEMARRGMGKGGGKQSRTIKLEAGSYKLQPRLHRGSLRILRLHRTNAPPPSRSLLPGAGA